MIPAWKSASKRGENAQQQRLSNGLAISPAPCRRQNTSSSFELIAKSTKQLVGTEVPYAGCVEAKLEQLDSDDFVAPQPTEVACREEGMQE